MLISSGKTKSQPRTCRVSWEAVELPREFIGSKGYLAWGSLKLRGHVLTLVEKGPTGWRHRCKEPKEPSLQARPFWW